MNTIQLATELRAITTRLVKKMRTKTPINDVLSLTERSTIFLLYQNGEMLPSELAAMEKVTTQSMSQILKHLFELGFIQRRISTNDKRKSIITLSKEGKDVVRAVGAGKEEWLHHALEQTCSQKELQMLSKVVSSLNKIVDFE